MLPDYVKTKKDHHFMLCICTLWWYVCTYKYSMKHCTSTIINCYFIKQATSTKCRAKMDSLKGNKKC